MKQKTLSIIAICLLLGSALLPNLNGYFTTAVESGIETSCYGFIVPLVKRDNSSIESHFSNIADNLINDLLREKITIFWLAENKSVSVKTIHSDEIEEIFFDMGSFVIPFSDNTSLNTKLTSIICDYNESNEINTNFTSIPVFLIMNNFSLRGYKLSEIKIAHYRTPFSTDSEIYYVNAAQKSGFFNFEFLNESSINSLNNEDFNFFIYGYGDIEISSFCPPLNKYICVPIFSVWEDIRFGVSAIIRQFVGNGGNYLGACHAAYRASTGLSVMPVKSYFRFASSHPDIPIIGVLSLIECSTPLQPFQFMIVELEIENTSHPIVYGLDSIVCDYYAGGPKFLDLGKNVHVISTFKNAFEELRGTPSWITSTFGKGKVILCSSHPELMYSRYGETGYKFLSNSYYYGTSELLEQIHIMLSRNMSFIKNIWNATMNLSISSNSTWNLFTNCTSKLKSLLHTFKDIEKEINNSFSLINSIWIEENYSFDRYSHAHYMGLCSTYIIKDNYLPLAIQYLEDTLVKINLTERFYSQIENNESLNSLNNLSNDLYTSITKMNESVLQMKSSCKKFYDSLNDYRNSTCKKLERRHVYDNLHKITTMVPTLFCDIVNNYFKIIKLVRHQWYDYETTLALNDL